MAGIYVTLELTKLHALVGRLQSHVDELAGRPELPSEITTDVKTAASSTSCRSTSKPWPPNSRPAAKAFPAPVTIRREVP